MNTSKIKAYAIGARRDFIKAVTERANFYGIFDDDNIEPMEIKGDVALIGQRAITEKEGLLRKRLVERVKKNGFEMTMRAAAYTWFNRLVALRYMELHDFLGHGFRVLSNPDQTDSATGYPEILSHATDVDLPGLEKEKVVELRLAGDKDNELYRLLLIAQCHALNRSMPFLFESIDNETELLLPENLLHSDSPIRKLVSDIPESDWQDVEIIGWIYQFYISERKDQVIGKVVASEDIPAATQLFTPNWIVKYMVQNTLGRMWLVTYPDSSLRDKMEYYIEPAEQEPEVQKKLDEITPKELDPEKITFMDPACGSGHILVEAYDVLKEMYLERGYQTREIPRLILEKNLYGLDIDDRAAQLSGFAVLMKARADDRKILSRDDLTLNIMAIQSTAHLNAKDLAWRIVEGTKVEAEAVVELIELFKNAKTFGSLISIPDHMGGQIGSLYDIDIIVREKLQSGDLSGQGAARQLLPYVRQGLLLSRKYDCVVTNPPYMGNKGMNAVLKSFAKKRFPNSKSDLFAIFIERNLELATSHGAVGMITMQSWMFLSSYEKLREKVLGKKTIFSMAHLGPRAFDTIGGEVVSTTTFILSAAHYMDFKGSFLRLVDESSEEGKRTKLAESINNPECGWLYKASAADFKKIPGSPIAYWVSDTLRHAFDKGFVLKEIGDTRQGMATSDNNRFLRLWHEVSFNKVCLNADSREHAVKICKKWFPYNKGGDFRKWYGNCEFLVNWENDGEELIDYAASLYGSATRTIKSISEYFKPCISWSKISSTNLAMRFYPPGYLFDVAGCSIFCKSDHKLKLLLGLTNTVMVRNLLKAISPTLNFEAGHVASIPIIEVNNVMLHDIINELIEKAKEDWNSSETSWDFLCLSLLDQEKHQKQIKTGYEAIRKHWQDITVQVQRLEEENNRIFIEAYGLQDELTPEVPLSEITLTCNPCYRYGGDKSEKELEALQRTDTMKELISYAIGCMMGRYSLDEPGLIYAHSGNIDFDPARYKTFQADDDGIIPVMDMEWFPDDATNRFVEFLKVAWSPETLEENLKFVADSLQAKRHEDPKDTIRRYLSTTFFKDHLRMYKKRPIYWLFSSGKHKAFECLVYLHRYNESTLSRMRSSYVTPLQGNIRARIEYLENEKAAATSATEQRKFQKEQEVLKKKQAELSKFDDELRHHADQRISLDLDDGVKINYGKFGNLLAETKTITGK